MANSKDIQFLYDRGMFAIKLGLENIENLLKYGNIGIEKLKTIHVAGTNGKGSTSNMISQILVGNGYKTGLFTSPHLVSFNERIRINGEMISDEELSSLISDLKGGIEKYNCTFFEASTAIAFKYFIENNVDIAVIEVGLGGRLDSTNIITPKISVITGIDIDHTAHLGNSIAKITGEKAGIIKEGIPVVFNVEKASAKQVIRSTAKKKNAPLIQVKNSEYKFEGKKVAFYLNNEKISSNFNLQGSYQKKNFSTALTTLEAINSRFPIKKEDTKKAIKNFVIKGRMEIISKEPFIMIDAAHNIQGLNELKKFTDSFNGKGVHLIAGMVKDKDYIGTIRKLLSFQAIKYFIGSKNPRILPIEKIKQECKKFKIDNNIGYYENVKDGFDSAMKTYEEGDLILITGSHFILGDFLEYYETKKIT